MSWAPSVSWIVESLLALTVAFIMVRQLGGKLENQSGMQARYRSKSLQHLFSAGFISIKLLKQPKYWLLVEFAPHFEVAS